MGDQNSNTSINTGRMPSPPTFLTDPNQRPVHTLRPSTYETSRYQLAVEEKQQAEMMYAEIYSKYVETVYFNENLIKKVRTLERFRKRVRPVYARAKLGDKTLVERLKAECRQYETTALAVVEENNSLKLSLQGYQEAVHNLSELLESTREEKQSTDHQFKLLAEETERRGLLLEKAENENSILKTRLEKIGEDPMTRLETLMGYMEIKLMQNQIETTQRLSSLLQKSPQPPVPQKTLPPPERNLPTAPQTSTDKQRVALQRIRHLVGEIRSHAFKLDLGS